MKAKVFFEKLKKQGKIVNEEFDKILESFPDVELGEVFPNLFDQEFLTRDRAVADPKIYDKIRAEQLDAVDAIIKEYIPFLDDKDKVDFQNEPKTFNKLKMLKPGLEKSFEKIKTENPNNDEKIKELNKQRQELADKITVLNKQWETTLTEKEKGFEKEKTSMKLDWTLDKKVAGYTIADEYKEVWPTLSKSVLDKIKAENVLLLDETGDIRVHEKSEAGTTKPKFINGSEPVTLDKLLEEPLKPFLKKSTGAPNGATAPQGGQGGTQGRPNTPPLGDRSKMTLKELNRAQV